MSAHQSAEASSEEADAWRMWQLQEEVLDPSNGETGLPQPDVCECGSNEEYFIDPKTNEPICTRCARVWDFEPVLVRGVKRSAYKPDNYLITVIYQHTGKIGKMHPFLAFVVERDLRERGEPIHPKTVRESLRRHKCSTKYVRSAASIAGFLGFRLPEVDAGTIDRLQALFQSIQAPYMKVKRQFKRKSFLHYPTVVRKLCERIGRHDIADCMPELKTPQRRKQSELLWQRIAEERGWHEQSGRSKEGDPAREQAGVREAH